MPPENQGLEYEFPFGMTHLQVRLLCLLLVSGSVRCRGQTSSLSWIHLGIWFFWVFFFGWEKGWSDGIKNTPPPKINGWKLEMMVETNRNLLFQGAPIFRFHVCFGGCNYINCLLMLKHKKKLFTMVDKSFEILTLEDGTFELHRKRSMKKEVQVKRYRKRLQWVM